MITKIDHNHPIFLIDAYQKDIVPFNLIEAIKSSAKLIMSDGESCIICSMLSPKYPAWVWTADGFDCSKIAEVCDCFDGSFIIDSMAHYVAKPDIAAALADKYIKEKDASSHRIQMQSFECPLLIPAKNSSIVPEKASPDDLDVIAEYCRNFYRDCFGREISNEDSVNDANSFIIGPRSFVIRHNGKPVAMAKSTRETGKHIAISEVYTFPEYRGMGYAAALVAHICKLILSEGKIPVLYTDLANPSSNKSYTNVGFVQCGRVDEIRLDWGK